MIDFPLTEEQQALRTLARDFGEKEIAPIAAELDRAAPGSANAFPWEVLKKAQDVGLRNLTMPQEYGGFGADVLTQSLVLDQLAYFDFNCAKILNQLWKVVDIIARGGTKEQKDRFLPAIRDDASYLLSLCFTEPDSGSDMILPYEGPDGGMRLTADPKGDGWVLNGIKHYISLAPQAKLCLVGARTDKRIGGNKAVSVFLVPKDTPGLSVGNIHDKICNHCYPSAELVFDNVYVPKENLLGGVHGWDHFAKASRGVGNLEIAGIGVAVARAAFENAVNFAKERVQGGKRIIQHQAVALRIADMYMLLEACDSMFWRSVLSVNRGQANAALLFATKVFTSESAVKIILEALQIFGGLGVMTELPMERYLRDSLLLLHGGGTADVLRIKINSVLAADPMFSRLL
jgi:alkylation response protein AidB-like acyl-CoA dehydrogenase